MDTHEIKLLREQLQKLSGKDFDLDAWKNHTIIFMERIFGVKSSKISMIRELRYDYSSWNLRDVAGVSKTTDPVKMQAAEILEAAIHELEQLGLPDELKPNEKLLALLHDELTGKQIKEIETILTSNAPDKTGKIKDILEKLDKEELSLILTRLLTS